jgi:hypothetical protein
MVSDRPTASATGVSKRDLLKFQATDKLIIKQNDLCCQQVKQRIPSKIGASPASMGAASMGVDRSFIAVFPAGSDNGLYVTLQPGPLLHRFLAV